MRIQSRLVTFHLVLLESAATCLALFFASPSAAQTGGIGDPKIYGYYPESVLAVGRGFSPNDITAPKLPCIKAKSVPLDPGPPITKFSSSYVKSVDDLTLNTNIDMKADAALLVGSANSEFKLDLTTVFNSTTVNIVIEGATDFGRWALEAPVQLTDDAKALLADPKNFEKNCGSRYVAIERRGSVAGMLISLESVSEDFKLNLSVDMSATGGAGELSASAEEHVKSELKRALKQDRVRIQVFATGGAGFGGLNDVAKGLGEKMDPIAAITAGLGTYIGQFTKENAPAFSYTVASMEQLGWDPHSVDPWTDEKESRLREITTAYRELTLELANAQNYLEHGVWEKTLKARLNEQEKSEIPAAIQQAKASKLALAEAHKKCKEQNALAACVVPTVKHVLVRDRIEGSSNQITQEVVFRFPDPPSIDFYIEPMCDDPVTPTSPSDCDKDLRLPQVRGERARAVLAAQPPIIQLQQFSPTARAFVAYLEVKGKYLDTGRLVFVDDNEHKSVVLTILQNAQHLFLWQRGPDPITTNSALGWITWSYMAHTGEKKSGTFYYELSDTLGRKFRLALVDAAWDYSLQQPLTLTETYY